MTLKHGITNTLFFPHLKILIPFCQLNLLNTFNVMQPYHVTVILMRADVIENYFFVDNIRKKTHFHAFNQVLVVIFNWQFRIQFVEKWSKI